MDNPFDSFIHPVGQLVKGVVVTLSWQAIASMGLLLLSLMLTLLYVGKWQKNFGVYYSLIFTIVPISLLGQYTVTTAETAGEALIGQYIIYIGGCFLIFFIDLLDLLVCN